MAVASNPAVSPKKTPTKTSAKKRKNQEMDATKGEDPSQAKQQNSSSDSKKQDQSEGNQVSRVRVVGKRVYDSVNGKSCHQCRQKTLDFSAECKNMKNNKQCTIRFCHKCLLNRYGEKAEDVSKLEDWNCPKCRCICNCSFCMKRKGQEPTGILVHTAKASGFMSVSQMLHVKGPEYASQERAAKSKSTSKKSVPSKENVEAVSLAEPLASNTAQLSSSHVKKSKKLKTEESAGTNEVKKDGGNANGHAKKSKKLKTEELAQTNEVKDGGNANGHVKKSKKLKREESAGAGEGKKDEGNASTHAKKSKKLKRDESSEISKVNKVEANGSCQDKSTVTSEKLKKKAKVLLSKDQAAKVEEWTDDFVIGLPNGHKDKKDTDKVIKQKNTAVAKEKVKKKKSNALSENQAAKPGNVQENNVNGQPAEEMVHMDSKEKGKKKKSKAKSVNKVVLDNAVNGLLEDATANMDAGNENKQGKSDLPKEKVKKKKIKAESGNQDAKPGDVLKKADKFQSIKSMVKKYDSNASNKEKFPVAKDECNQKLNAESDACSAKLVEVPKKVEPVMPKGIEMTSLVNIDFSPEDIGNALQLMEFCAAFGEILDVRKGQPALVLRDIMVGRTRRGKCSALVQFQIQLLSLIQKEDAESDEMPSLSSTDGKDCWLHAVKKCISEYKWALKDMPDHCFDGTIGYEMLSPSQKLKLAVFLCDETLNTVQLRAWIEEKNQKFKEKKKEAREKVTAAKEKEKTVKKKMQDEIAAAIIARNGSAPLSIAEHEAMFTEIRAEAERVHAEMLETMGMVPKDDQLPAVVRTSPVYLDSKNGHVYWRMKGYNQSDVLRQDVGLHGATSDDRWYSFNEEDKKAVEDYISFPRVMKQRKPKEKSIPKVENNRLISDSIPKLINEEPDLKNEEPK